MTEDTTKSRHAVLLHGHLVGWHAKASPRRADENILPIIPSHTNTVINVPTENQLPGRSFTTGDPVKIVTGLKPGRVWHNGGKRKDKREIFVSQTHFLLTISFKIRHLGSQEASYCHLLWECPLLGKEIMFNWEKRLFGFNQSNAVNIKTKYLLGILRKDMT